MYLKEVSNKFADVIIIMTSLVAMLSMASCSNSNRKGIVNNDSIKTEVVSDTVKVKTATKVEEGVEKSGTISYKGRNDVVLVDNKYCKISHKGRKLIVEWLDKKGHPLSKDEKPFENKITETVCHNGYVYVVVDMLEEGEVSKVPFIGLYKVDLKKDSWEFLETSSYINFDTRKGKAKLKTAAGLAGECEADGYLWEEKTIDL